MKVFLPATAVMFFMGLILGGPGWADGEGRDAQKRTGRRQRSLVDVVGRRPWNFENNVGGVNRKGIGRGGGKEKKEGRKRKEREIEIQVNN